MRKLLLPLFAFTLVLLVACGGGGGGSGDEGATNTSNEPAGGAASSQTLDLSRATQKLTEDVRSFRFDLKMQLDLGDLATPPTSGEPEDEFGAALAGAFFAMFSDMQLEGSMANGDVDMTVKFLGEEARYIQVGNRAWVNSGNGWEETEPGDAPIDSPADLMKEFVPQEILNAAKVTKENVNGASATRYSFDKAALVQLAEDAGESTADFDQVDKANLDVWVNGDGVPVKIVMDMSGTDEEDGKISIVLEVNIRDINNSSIKVTAPV